MWPADCADGEDESLEGKDAYRAVVAERRGDEHGEW